MGKPMMIARSCSVTFRDHIEFFEAIHETGRPVNVSGAGGPEDGLVSLSAPFAEILLENHSLFHGANLNVLEISPRADIVIPYDFDGGSARTFYYRPHNLWGNFIYKAESAGNIS